jgi:hypothetical protein
MDKIYTTKEIITEFCNKKLKTHTDWTGTRVETINLCDNVNDFINDLYEYLEYNHQNYIKKLI